ncbi:hypothetical protein PU629_07400 [Pullulanibacillus sp. KACC 23026]|nr:hypothetical protein [Pullulanibacillus sp. KACC 23026]WEG14183.1 hypothetical protein PU629_07400 [Pullulanibacillus sp. KACC 23026]
MFNIAKSITIAAAKKAVKIDPQDFITQDNVTTAVKIAGHVIKWLF